MPFILKQRMIAKQYCHSEFELRYAATQTCGEREGGREREREREEGGGGGEKEKSGFQGTIKRNLKMGGAFLRRRRVRLKLGN